jgi:heat shock protein HspQ
MKHPALSSLLLVGTLASLALVSPASARSASAQDRTERRIYDRAHKDYHVWTDQEDRAYHRYLEERHLSYHDYGRLKATQQRNYWNWRHAHPDGDDHR